MTTYLNIVLSLGIGPPGAESMFIGIVLDDLLGLPDDASSAQERFVLVAFGGEVPVVVDSGPLEFGFSTSQTDDLVCVGSDGSVRLLRSFQSMSRNVSNTTHSSSSSSDRNTVTNGGSFSRRDKDKDNHSFCRYEIYKVDDCIFFISDLFYRPFGFAFRKGSQYNDGGEPVAYLVRGEKRNHMTVKFREFLESELMDTDEWQQVVTSPSQQPTNAVNEPQKEENTDNSTDSSPPPPPMRYQQVAVVKGLRVVLMEQLDAYSLYQNTLAVKLQIVRFKQMLQAQREIHKKQQLQIEEQNRILDEQRNMLSKLEH